MARFTIDDCMENNPDLKNRFLMTLAAATRARQIEHGSETFLNDDENDKPTVLALREISMNYIDSTILNSIE